MKIYYIDSAVTFDEEDLAVRSSPAEHLKATADRLEGLSKKFRRLAGFALETEGVSVDVTGSRTYVEGPEARLEALVEEHVLSSVDDSTVDAPNVPVDVLPERATDAQLLAKIFTRAFEDESAVIDMVAQAEIDREMAQYAEALLCLQRAYEAKDPEVMASELNRADTLFRELSGEAPAWVYDDNKLIDEDPP